MTTQIDFEQARFNMIEQQIRTWEVLDQNVLNLLQEIHREDFVPDEYRQLALADLNIPLANGQVMMTPKLEARLLQALAILKSDNVLEIGTGSAYLTALLARSANHVDSVDIFSNFGTDALSKLERYEINNVDLHTGDALSEWRSDKQHDVIVVTGSLPKIIPALQEQLRNGGRLFAIVGESPVMEARLVTRIDAEKYADEALFETDLPPLIGIEKSSLFQF
ncbi:MAG: protein-L-isoaspartate(D-aspartate) O-methyltransferase [Gammaproteobacteria bacterium]|jgi:protein-L-isoaspartate(D-aspartate) O-methyltransferase